MTAVTAIHSGGAAGEDTGSPAVPLTLMAVTCAECEYFQHPVVMSTWDLYRYCDPWSSFKMEKGVQEGRRGGSVVQW